MNYYGRQNGDLRGINPPTLLFSAYGPYMYDKVPMLIRNVSFGLDQDVDYISCGSDFNSPISTTGIRDPGYGLYTSQDIDTLERAGMTDSGGYATDYQGGGFDQNLEDNIRQSEAQMSRLREQYLKVLGALEFAAIQKQEAESATDSTDSEDVTS